MNKIIRYILYIATTLICNLSLQGSIVRVQLLEKVRAHGATQRIGIFHEIHDHALDAEDGQAKALFSNFESISSEEKVLGLEGVSLNDNESFTSKKGLSIKHTFSQLITSLCSKADKLYGTKTSTHTQRALKAAENLCNKDSTFDKIDNNTLLVNLSSLVNGSTVVNSDEERLYLNLLLMMFTFKDIFEISKALGNQNLAEHKSAQEIIEGFNIPIGDFLGKIAHIFEQFEKLSLACYKQLTNQQNKETCKNLLNDFSYTNNQVLATYSVQNSLSEKFKNKKLLDEAFFVNTTHSSNLSKDQQIFSKFLRTLLQLVDQTTSSGMLLSWMLELNIIAQIHADSSPSVMWFVVGNGHADNLGHVLKPEGYDTIYDSFVSLKTEEGDTSDFIVVDPDQVEYDSDYVLPLAVDHFSHVVKSTKNCKRLYAQNREHVVYITDGYDSKDEL